MHIPDGYLSPSTCATLYALAGSGWYTALKRVKRALFTRAIPLISVFAAFSFVLMMFNIPLPGGTTGHAVGVTIAAVVLGPWGAILAISMALAIQALFFGDGGVTTLGANCFNMAIVGSLVAWAAYRLISGTSTVVSRRRVIAAGVAGYIGINAAALVTAFEFGVQPMLFHDANGVPLYAPYPLHIAVPAMMIGHLTVAGLAEAAVSAGMLAYLQKANPALLEGIGVTQLSSAERSAASVRSLRRLWLVIAMLLVLTPVGILAVGTAWGEWSPEDLAHSETRAAITSVSGGALPDSVPRGLQRLSSTWTAPFPDYAPAFIKSEKLGYLLSGMFGVGIVLVLSILAQRIAYRRFREGPHSRREQELTS